MCIIRITMPCYIVMGWVSISILIHTHARMHTHSLMSVTSNHIYASYYIDIIICSQPYICSAFANPSLFVAG